MITTKTRQLLSLTLSCVATFMAASPTLGQDITSGSSSLEKEQHPEADQRLMVSPGFTYISEADFDHHSTLGSVSVVRGDIRPIYTIKQGDAEFGVGGLYEYSRYNLSRSADEDFNRLGLNAYFKGMADEHWGYFGYGSVEMAASTEANLDDGVLGTVAGGGRYVWSETLSLGLGLAYSTSLEDDNFILPLIILKWQINDRLLLRTLNGVTLQYDLTGDKKTFLDGTVNYQRREYRLAKNSSVGFSGNEASLIETMIALEIGVTHNFTGQIAVRGFVGAAAGRKFDVRDNDRKIADEDVDPAPLVGIRAIFLF